MREHENEKYDEKNDPHVSFAGIALVPRGTRATRNADDICVTLSLTFYFSLALSLRESLTFLPVCLRQVDA